MYALAATPAAQPITGVIASTVPNTRPVRRASLRRGRSSTEPLPRAAAKASADMLNARTTMANKLMTGGDRRAGTVRDRKPAGTASGAYWSREAEFSLCRPCHALGASMLTRTRLGWRKLLPNALWLPSHARFVKNGHPAITLER